MDQKFTVCTDILNQLGSAGFPAAFLPYHCIAKIAETYDELPLIRNNTTFIQNTAYPQELARKLRQFGINNFMMPVAGRNARLELLNNYIR